jgi:hypothetical protein
MATAFFRKDHFLHSSYFTQDVWPAIEEQAKADGDSAKFSDLSKRASNLYLIEIRSEQEYFTHELNALMVPLESCGFREIEEEEFLGLSTPKKKEEPAPPATDEILTYRQEHAYRSWGWKPGDMLPSRSPMGEQYWYVSIDRDWFGVGNSAFADLPEEGILLCHECATKTLVDASIRPWACSRGKGLGYCGMCGKGNPNYREILRDLAGGQGYIEGMHGRD